MLCPLCEKKKTQEVFRREEKPGEERVYMLCNNCQLVFVPEAFHINREQENVRYDTHENNPDDKGYRHFLSRAIDPLLSKLEKGMEGLDFGSGPGPTISVIMKEKGFSMKNYDPFYAPDKTLLQKQYDFITCTETAEHFRNPRKEFLQLNTLLVSGGFLSLMTERLESIEKLGKWWYITDPTHIALYQKETMDWIADWQKWKIEQVGKTVTLFTKKER